MEKETCKTLLKIITNKKYVHFVSRGNEAIKIALAITKTLGRTNCLIQEEGGWLKYEKFIKDVYMEPIRLVTNYGLIFEKELKYHSHDSVLLLNSLAGYIVMHDMAKVYDACILNDIFLINDVSGSIGTEEAKFGEILLGSFGIDKPVNLGEGGFIAFDDESWQDFLKDVEEPQLNYKLLEDVLKNLPERRRKLLNISKKVKEDLKDYNIVHKEADGINVVVKFSNEEEKQKLINYCKQNNYEYTLCPREIRILDDAVSIEIKRL